MKRLAALALGGLLGAGALGIGGCGSGEAPSPTADGGPATLVLVTLDTFRQDHLGCAGNPVVRTPHLDRLARRGATWTEAVSAIPLTTPSHASILSGISPRGHGLVKNRMSLAEHVRTVPQRLAEAGWRTAAVVSARVVLGPEFGLDRGFATYDVIDPESRPASGEGARTAAAAIARLADPEGPEGEAPLFLWAHFFDAHLPYTAPAPWNVLYDPEYDGALLHGAPTSQERLHEGPDIAARDVAWLAAQYAGEVSFLDGCVGRLVRAADPERTVFLVTADHGEGLYEHARYFGHDILLYDTALRIPFVLAGPTVPPGMHAGSASTLDIAATLLGLAGAPSGGTEGLDLLRSAPREGDDCMFVAESHPVREKSWPIYALRTPDAKVIWTPRHRLVECYDLADDPAERDDLSATESRFFRILTEDLEIDLRTRPVGTARTVDEERGGADEETLEALRALGYVN